MIGKIIDFIIGKASFVITVKDPHDVAVFNILRESGFYGCRVSQGKITFSCDCEKAKEISKNLDALEVPYEKSVSGLVYYVKRLFFRPGLSVGVAGALLLNALFTSTVWNIDIRGNSTVSDADIMRGLYKLGVYEGVKKSDVDIKSLTRDYMLTDDRLSFMHMNINGVRATVEVAEAVKKSQSGNDKKEVCNIVARCDGVITRMDVYSGGREVENGQSVVKGQLLISSFFETRTVGHLLRRAKGTVFARTEPVFEMRIPKKKFTRSHTGEKTRRSISFLNFSLPLDGENVVFDEKSVCLETEKKPMYLFGMLNIPITLVSEKFGYSEFLPEKRTENEARGMFEREYEVWKKSFSESGEILSCEQEMLEEDDCFVFVCRLSCIESIGFDKPFEIREN